jgi:hypothetical protein
MNLKNVVESFLWTNTLHNDSNINVYRVYEYGIDNSEF